MAKTRSNFADGMRAAKETQRDLDWTQKKVRLVLRNRRVDDLPLTSLPAL